jgi:hypothetical protein
MCIIESAAGNKQAYGATADHFALLLPWFEIQGQIIPWNETVEPLCCKD